MTYKINTADDMTLEFEQNDEVKSVLQNVALLLSTKQGTVPMYREFGLPMEFIDKPLEVAETLAFAEITEALERFEPRAVLEDISFEKTESGKMSLIVEVSISEQNE